MSDSGSLSATVNFESRRSRSLRHFSPKRIAKMKLFKTNSVPHVEDKLLKALDQSAKRSASRPSSPAPSTIPTPPQTPPSTLRVSEPETNSKSTPNTPLVNHIPTISIDTLTSPSSSSEADDMDTTGYKNVGPLPASTGTPVQRGASRGSSSSGSSGTQGTNTGVTTTGAGLTSSTQTLGVTATPRSLSLASISSEGSTESHLVEQEDIVTLSTAVRSFKEALSKLRKIFNPDRDKSETLCVTAHERLGEVLRILKSILEKYSPIQHNELLGAASNLISHVNGFNYENEKADPGEFLEAIDQLALTFSSRVSEYLMGDIDTSHNCSTSSSRTKSCDNLLSSDAESTGGDRAGSSGTTSGSGNVPAHVPGGFISCQSGPMPPDPGLQKDPELLTPQDIDSLLHRQDQGVECALHRAKLWSKYAKDIMTYVEKRAQLEVDYARNLTKLAHAIRPALKEESFLPFQSIYCTTLDQDLENCNNLQTTCTLLTTHKFIEPLVARRNDHERARKAIKETWHKELKKVNEAVNNLKKAKMLYIQRNQDLIKLKDSLQKSDSPEQFEKIERKIEESQQKLREATKSYKSCVEDANERNVNLLKVKRDVLQQTRELILQCDQTMKSVTVAYFQLQHTVAAPTPVQLQALCESSRLYEPGSHYMEFVKRLSVSNASKTPVERPFVFELFTPGTSNNSSNGSITTSSDDLQVERVTGGSDTDSVGSSRSAKSGDGSPTSSPVPPSRRGHTISSGDELEAEADTDWLRASRSQLMSNAAVSHTFKKLKTPSRCRECDSYVYFHGFECGECGLTCHKKCLETLAIQCGHKRLPRKMTTFGVDLGQHLSETGASVPHLLLKCVAEIDNRGSGIKGIYRVSGLKSRVEKLCQAFENGAHLVDLSDQHPNVIANVLKLYLRQLPEPLLTFRLYPEFIRIAKEYPANGSHDLNKIVEDIKDLVKKLPRQHLQCLAVLMQHLNRIANLNHLNNMPPLNLGIVFGPTLLRTSEGSDPLSSLVDTVHQTRAIELLVQTATQVFGLGDQNLIPKELLPATQLSSASSSSSSSSASSSSSSTAAFGQSSSSSIKRHQKIEEGIPMHGTRQGSIPSSGSTGNMPVGIAGANRSGFVCDEFGTPSATPTATPTPPTARQLKDRKGSDLLDDEWDWEADDLASCDAPDGHPCRVPTPSVAGSMGGASVIVKTSLKNYVGLEAVMLHEVSNPHDSLEIPSHPKLRKTLSDNPPIQKQGQVPDAPKKSATEENLQKASQDVTSGKKTQVSASQTHVSTTQAQNIPTSVPQLNLHQQLLIQHQQQQQHYQHLHQQNIQQKQQTQQQILHQQQQLQQQCIQQFQATHQHGPQENLKKYAIGRSSQEDKSDLYKKNVEEFHHPSTVTKIMHPEETYRLAHGASKTEKVSAKKPPDDGNVRNEVKKDQQAMARLKQAYKTESRSNIGDAEIKVEVVRTSGRSTDPRGISNMDSSDSHNSPNTSHGLTNVGTSVPSSTSCTSPAVSLAGVKVSTVPSVTTKLTELSKGADSSIDSDYSFDGDVRQSNSSSSHSTPTQALHHPTVFGSLSAIGALINTPLMSQRTVKGRPIAITPKDISSPKNIKNTPQDYSESTISREASLENITSSDSSSQEPDSAHLTEESHSSVETSEDQETGRSPGCYQSHQGQSYQPAGTLMIDPGSNTSSKSNSSTSISSSGIGGSSSNSQGASDSYVSPYLSNERTGLMTLGPSLLLTRSTIAQYDTRRTVTTVVSQPKTSQSFDENKVRIQVPAAENEDSSSVPGENSDTSNEEYKNTRTTNVKKTKQNSGKEDINNKSQTTIEKSESTRKPSPYREPRFV